MQAEYGGVGNFRFADMKYTVVDSSGNEVLCKCGKPSSGGAIGKEAFIVWCSECDPNKSQVLAQFVYRPPKTSEPAPTPDFIKISGERKVFVEDAWVVNLLKKSEEC